MTHPEAAYFADENLLGLGKLLLRSGRTDVLFPGHDRLPEVPLGALDVEWMPVVAARGLIVLTRDKRIRTRPAELDAYRSLGIRSVWLGGKHDLGPREQVALFLEREPLLQREAERLGPGPWALALTPSGIRELTIRSTH